MQMNGSAPTQTQAALQQTATQDDNNMLVMLAELRKLMQPKDAGQYGTLRIGVSYGLIEYLLDKKEDNRVATTFRTGLFSGSNFRFKSREEVGSPEASKIFVEELQQMAGERGSALEVNIGLTYVEIEQLAEAMLNGADGVPFTYATFEVELLGPLEGKKRLVKDAEGNEEEKFFLKAGSVKFAGNVAQASNPFADDSILCSKEEFKAGMLRTFDRSREGFQNWAAARNEASKSDKPTASNGPDLGNLIASIPIVG